MDASELSLQNAHLTGYGDEFAMFQLRSLGASLHAKFRTPNSLQLFLVRLDNSRFGLGIGRFDFDVGVDAVAS